MTVFNLRVGSATHVGQLRTINQDAIVTGGGIYGVADGMGGHQGGEVASAVAVDSLANGMRSNTPAGFEDAVKAANLAVFEQGQARDDLAGMGTTLVALAEIDVEGVPHVVLVNVGDSRGYLLRDPDLVQITEDHSLVADLVRAGRITAEEAETHPRRNIVTRVLGLDENIRVDQFAVPPVEGDRFLMCSDGLTNEVSEADIAATLRRIEDPDEAASELVRMANEAGGRDNITVLIVDVLDSAGRMVRPTAPLVDPTETHRSPADREGLDELASAAEEIRREETDDPVPVDALDALGALGATSVAGSTDDADPSMDFEDPESDQTADLAPGTESDTDTDHEVAADVADAEAPDEAPAAGSGFRDEPDAGLDDPSGAHTEPDDVPDEDDEPGGLAGGDSEPPDDATSETELVSDEPGHDEATDATDDEDLVAGEESPVEPGDADEAVETVGPDETDDADEPDDDEPLSRRDRKKRDKAAAAEAAEADDEPESGNGDGVVIKADRADAANAPETPDTDTDADADEPEPGDATPARKIDEDLDDEPAPGSRKARRAAKAKRKAEKPGEVDDLAGFAQALDDDQLADADSDIGAEADLGDLMPTRRRFSWRVAAFLFIFCAVIGIAAGALGVYARGTYFVGFENSRVVVFQGRPGGVLFFQPTVEADTNVVRSDLLPVSAQRIDGKPDFGSFSDADRFVANLQLVDLDQVPETGPPGAFDRTSTATTSTTVSDTTGGSGEPPPDEAPLPSRAPTSAESPDTTNG